MSYSHNSNNFAKWPEARRKSALGALGFGRSSQVLTGVFLVVTFFFLCLEVMYERLDSTDAHDSLFHHSLRRPSIEISDGGGRRTEPTTRSRIRVVIPISNVTSFLNDFLNELQVRIRQYKPNTSTYLDIWQMYHDLVLEKVFPWDQHYLQNLPDRRKDDSIFLSVASYRDENCLSTLQDAYSKAKYPEKLYTGLVQQNCNQNCTSGVLEGGVTEPAGPDADCHQLFCESLEGRPHCETGRVRVLNIEESASLGPYTARFFASKLWQGEQWFMQVRTYHKINRELTPVL
jgi:hypothetical protein